MGDGGADAGQEEQTGAENARGGALCCCLTFQTLLQPVRMAHPWNLLHSSRAGSAIFRMPAAESCEEGLCLGEIRLAQWSRSEGARRPNGPKSTPRIVCFKVGESKEGAFDGRTSPRWKLAAYKPPGKATKRPSPPANPGITAEGEVGVGSPSKVSRKKANQTSKMPPLRKGMPQAQGLQ